MSDTPSLQSFDPRVIPYQYRVIQDIRSRFDYSLGVHELLLSGSVGSAKSLLMAHLGVTHCLQNEKARFCLARKSMPDLKDTILQTVLDHMEEDLVEGEDYEFNRTKGKITFSNGSEIISRSWADKKYKKFRSLKLSGAGVEELTENDDEDKQAYLELKMRLGRLPHVKENFIVSATNPDSPAHWAYKYFIAAKSPTIHVYYSVTTDNPFLPSQYIEQLKKDLDPKMARRMIYGEWLEIATEVVYHQYDRSKNFRDSDYQIEPGVPVSVNFDFNIGHGKPMSACFHQFVGDRFHFFDEAVVEGADTEQLLEEIAGRGLFDHPVKYLIRGDASGKSRDTRSKRSDYDIIVRFLSNYRTPTGQPVQFELQVPLSNPPIRTRHNTVNAYMQNAHGDIRLYVYRACKSLDEGFRLVKLKPGAQYVEDDSKAYQHVTTAAGYGIMRDVQGLNFKRQGTVEA